MSSTRHWVTNRLPRPSFLLQNIGVNIDGGIDIDIVMDIGIDIEKTPVHALGLLDKG